MGWTSTHKPEGQTAKQFLIEQFTKDEEHNTWKVLKSAVKLTVGYFQIEHVIKATGKRQVFALVVHITHTPSEYHNITWKEVDESMGPYEVDCPLDILNGLDEPENEYSRQWRENVRAFHASKKQLPKDGQWVQFERPIKFSDGKHRALFQCKKQNRKTYFVSDSDGVSVKITRRALQGEGVTVHNQKPQAVAV